ncbi:MAG: hypothetical protein NVSMB31_02160 [Vulcanimicrobiaceae bacterium]
MVRTLIQSIAVFLLAMATFAAPAAANTGDLGSVVDSANLVIKNAQQQQTAHTAITGTTTIGQVPPVSQPPVSSGPQKLGLPKGFTYTFDFSAAYPYGDIGTGKHWLNGGVDTVLSYGFNSHQRIVLNYYELQHYPVGFNTGTRAFYLPPSIPQNPLVGNPGCVNLNNTPGGGCSASSIDVTTKDRFFLAYFNQLITIGGGKRTIPIVISPTYVSRGSSVAASNGHGDVVPFVDANGIPHFDIATRTAQVKSIAFTMPFLKTPKMFGTFTVAPSWLVHTAGLNQDNHAQLYQILYLEYNMNDRTKFFFEPQSSRDYLPADPYAQHLNAYFLGASEKIGKIAFVQLVLNSGSPSNYSPYGVKYFQCFTLPCSKGTVPAVGGLKATQLQLQLGIGSPSVLQF